MALLATIVPQSLCDPLLRFATLPIRYIDQAGDPADKGVLITGQDAIRIGHIPQHLDDADTFFLVEVLDNNVGKMMEIGRLDRPFLCRLHEARYLAAIQAEAPGQGALDYAPFANLDSVVAAGNFDQQHGKRPILAAVEWNRVEYFGAGRICSPLNFARARAVLFTDLVDERLELKRVRRRCAVEGLRRKSRLQIAIEKHAHPGRQYQRL